MKDLFEYPDQQPEELRIICEKYEEYPQLTYSECEQFKNEVEAIGYTFDYYLDGEPIDLRKIN